MMVVPPMQSISGENDGTYTLYLFMGGYPKFRVKMASGELSNFDAF